MGSSPTAVMKALLPTAEPAMPTHASRYLRRRVWRDVYDQAIADGERILWHAMTPRPGIRQLEVTPL